MSERLRILITDDEEQMRYVVKRALRRYSLSESDLSLKAEFEVDEAGTGEEALEKIASNPPDLLLLDLKLPGISGIDVLNRLAEDPPADMLTIMITAYASIQTAVAVTKQGVYDFLAKPFTPDELRSVVRKAARHLIMQRQSRLLVEEKRRVRFEFISVLAHELKSPINAVDGYIDTLAQDYARNDPAVYDRVLERCHVRLEGMRKLILDLLDMTRIESGRKKREIGNVDVVEVAEAALESAALAAKERSISTRLNVEGPVEMRADRGEIEIILNNLTSNAVKYNRDGGSVEVTLRAEGEVVTIVVADTGIGLSKDEAAKLFNDFVRIKNSKTKNILGSGLGLSIVKKLADLYRGTATVASEPGVGSTSTVVLHSET